MSTRKENAVSRIRKKQQQQQQQQYQAAVAAVAAAAASGGTLYGYDYPTAASSSSSDNIYSDPFHNGQTPACTLLRSAVNDIFPELQQQEQNPIPQSQLGKLLRWQFFKNRRERRQKIQIQQELILASNNEETSENTRQAATATDQSTTGNTTSSSKRKKKKKKKKKAGAGAGTVQGTGGDTTNTAPGSHSPSNREIPSVTSPPPPPQYLPEDDLDEFQMELKDETTEHSSTFLQLDEKSVGEISVDLLDEVIDKSLKVHDTQMQQANAEAHSLLESLPSDEMKSTEENDMEQSISAYFQQIQPEAATTFPEDNDMLSSPSGGTSASGRGPHQQQGSLVADSILVSPPFPPSSIHDEKFLSSPPRTPVSSKHHLNNGGGVMTTPTRNNQQRPSPPSNISNNQIDLMNSPTHEWIPTDGDVGGGSRSQTNHETAPQLAVIKNPLELPFLLTLKNTDSGNGVVTTTSAIDGSLIPVESNHRTSGSAEAEDNAPGSYETTKALLEEWLDQLDSNNNSESNENETNDQNDDRKAHGEYQSFLEYLQKRCYIHNNNTSNSNPASKKSSGSKKGTGGIIAKFQTIQDYVSGIDCPNCRQDAFVELEKLQQKSGPFMLCTKCLKGPPKPTDESIDAAFDYVALEEGRHMNLLPTAPTLSTSSITEDDDEEGEPSPADKSTNLCLVLVEPSSKQQQQSKSSKNNNNNSKQLFLESLTSAQLDTLVEQWLPCGIEEDVMVTTSVVQTPPSTTEGTQPNDDDSIKQQQNQQQPKKRVGGGSIVLHHAELTDLQNRVLRHENDTRAKLLELQAEGQQLIDQLDTYLTSTTQAVNFEVSKYPELKNCDDRCHEYSERLLEILLSCTSERSHALADIQLQLWTTLLEGLNGALVACDIYYDKLQNDLIDQTGALPRIFLSKPLRDVYHRLLHEKARLWTNIGTEFMNVLLTSPSSPNSTSRILKEWYTRSVWEQHELRNNHNSAIPIDNHHDTMIHENDEYVPNDPLDDKCHEIVEKLVRWTDAMVGGHIRDIQKDRMKQTSAILKLLQSTVEPLSQEYSTVERFFSKDRNQYFASLRSNIVLAQGVKDMMRLIDDKEVKHMALGVLVMWRHVRIMQSRMDIAPTSSVLTPSQGLQPPRPLPLQLKRWYLLQDDDRFMDGRGDHHGVWSNHQGYTCYDHHQMFCQLGTGGKRRLTCILVGLIYQWLEQECQEWKAAKAEQELLGDFDNLMGTSTTTSSSSGDLAMLDSSNNKNGGAVQQQKSGKSNKKKKKKNRNSSVAAAAPDSSVPHNENKNNGNTTAEGPPLSSSTKAISKADDNEQSDNDKNRTAVKAEGKDATNCTSIVAHKEESASIVAAGEGKDVPSDTDAVATMANEKLAAGNENLSDDYVPGRGVEESKDVEPAAADEACTPNIVDVKTKEPPAIPPDAIEASDPEEEKVEEEAISEHVIDQLCFENVKVSDNRNNTIFTPGDFLIGRLEAIMQTVNKTNNNRKKKNVVVMI